MSTISETVQSRVVKLEVAGVYLDNLNSHTENYEQNVFGKNVSTK